MTRKLFANYTCLCNANQSPVVYPEVTALLIRSTHSLLPVSQTSKCYQWKAQLSRPPVCPTLNIMEAVPELLSDWDDLDSEMRLRRFAAATQPSLLVRRFFTNLQTVRQTVKLTTTYVSIYTAYLISNCQLNKTKPISDLHKFTFGFLWLRNDEMLTTVRPLPLWLAGPCLRFWRTAPEVPPSRSPSPPYTSLEPEGSKGHQRRSVRAQRATTPVHWM